VSDIAVWCYLVLLFLPLSFKKWKLHLK